MNGAINVLKGLISAFPKSTYVPKAKALIEESKTLKKKIDAKKRRATGLAEQEAREKAFDPAASFAEGMANIRKLKTMNQADAVTLDFEHKSIYQMWNAITFQHNKEGYTGAVSDQIIIWVIGNPNEMKPGYADVLVERIIQNEKNKNQLRWLAAKTRMLADRFTDIDPTQGGNEIRNGNLDLLKFWMTELLHASYFENNYVAGMYKYKGDRRAEFYDQTDATFKKFKAALYYYSQGLKKAKTRKGMAVLHLHASQLCSRFRSETPTRLETYYNKGLLHAKRGILMMASADKESVERGGKQLFAYEKKNAEIRRQLEEYYGRNLLLYIYQLFQQKKYTTITNMADFIMRSDFDWEGKLDTLLIFAESARQAAANSLKGSEAKYQKYKKLCLWTSSKAFKFALAKNKGQPQAQNNEDFCKAFNAYYNYLSGFGQLLPASQLENQYGSYCPR